MSKLAQLHYRRLVNLGNYENEAIELVVELEPGDSLENELAWLRDWVATHLPGALPAPDHGAAERQLLADTATDLDPEWNALQRGPDPAPDPAPARPPGLTERQLRAIYAIGRKAAGLTDTMIDARCAAQYGCPPDELSKAEASQFIDALKGDEAI